MSACHVVGTPNSGQDAAQVFLGGRPSAFQSGKRFCAADE